MLGLLMEVEKELIGRIAVFFWRASFSCWTFVLGLWTFDRACSGHCLEMRWNLFGQVSPILDTLLVDFAELRW